MKMEIELSDSQAEKVEILKSNDMSVGDAIDMLFDLKDEISHSSNLFIDSKISDANKEKEELQKRIGEIDGEISVFKKLKESSLDYEQVRKLIEKEYLRNETYDKTVQDSKHKFKWSKRIFKL